LKIKFKGAGRKGFSLTEMLVVVLIMGVLVGVVGSLMGGFVTNFEMTDDQSLARRRAQDVFNILQTPILNAGLGIPSVSFDYYFGPLDSGVGGAPIKTWAGPIEVISHNNITSSTRFKATENRGDALRIVYSVYSGVKNVSSEDIVAFSGKPEDAITPQTLDLSGNAPVGGDGIQYAGNNFVHSYVTFPGISMHPEIVTGHDGDTTKLNVSGKRPHAISDDDVLPRNVIRAYHDMLLVKAALAYVDDNGTFCLYDINDDTFDPGPGVSLRTAASADADIAGKLVYRVEGIKAVRFVPETSAADGRVTGVNVYVLAEGDNAVTGRTSTSHAVQEVRNRVFPLGSPLAGAQIWPNSEFDPNKINWNDEIYYEDFEMRWRTRNIEAPTP
jgi:prepilin-type N-terminal cleavage/methylation domain-containing protein